MIYSQNEEELISIGQKLGRLLDSGDIIVLSGDLGAGKTTLTKGIAKGLDISQMIKSPTYTIVREYEGRLPLYHLDVYRIGDDPDSIDLDDFLFGDGATIIEWGELIEPSLSDAYLKIFIRDESLLGDYLLISISHHGDGRRLLFESFGPRSKEIQEEMVNG